MTQEVVTTKKKGDTLKHLLAISRTEIQAALPRHVTPDRMLRIAMTCARVNTELLDCTPESFLGAVIQSAQLGLEPGHSLGHAYLIPFKNNKTGAKEVQFMPGYRGLMDLIYRGQNHPTVMPRAVYENDKFEYGYGTNPYISHTPTMRPDKSKLTHAYCVATFPDGRKEFMVLSRPEIEEVRLRSRAASSQYSPWKTDYESMCLKTVIKRFVKYLPMSIEVQKAIILDDLAEIGESQRNEEFLKPENAPVVTKSERLADKMDLKSGDFGFDER